MTASPSTKLQYLLPGERDSSSSIVHHHGISKIVSSSPLPRVPENSFIFTPRIYKPKENDLILGTIIVRTSDLFVVDINSTDVAILPTASFDRGCLPPRDAMNRLSVVYARVVCVDPWTQVELSCQTLDRAKNRSDLGLLDYGTVVRCSLGVCQRLQQSPLINHFNRLVKNFDARVSSNGMLWYTTDTMNSMIAVKNVIRQHELENDTDRLIDLYQRLIRALEQQQQQVIKLDDANK